MNFLLQEFIILYSNFIFKEHIQKLYSTNLNTQHLPYNKIPCILQPKTAFQILILKYKAESASPFPNKFKCVY